MERVGMRRSFESGLAFMVVGLLCMVAAVISDQTAVFIALGTFWWIVAFVVRAKQAEKVSGDEEGDG